MGKLVPNRTVCPLGSPCAPGSRQDLYQSFLSTTHVAVAVTFSVLGMGSVASEPRLVSPSYQEAEQGLELLTLCHWTLCSIETAPPWNSGVQTPHPNPEAWGPH